MFLAADISLFSAIWPMFAYLVPIAVLAIGGEYALARFMPPRLTFHDRTERLTRRLETMGRDADELLTEMRRMTAHRSNTLKTLEQKLNTLSEQEVHLTKRIEVLQATDPEAAKAFSDLLEDREHRNRPREYAFAAGGVAITLVFEVVMKQLGIL